MKYYVTLLMCSLYLPACATATRGTHERVMINSEPPGATAVSDVKAAKPMTYDDGQTYDFLGCAPTPCGINFSRRSEPVINVWMKDHQPIKFKVVSTWEAGSSSIREGAIVSGTPRGSYVVVGKPDIFKTIPVGGGMLTSGLISWGVAPAIDLTTGANRSLSPNPVTVFLAPDPNYQPVDESEGFK